MVNKEICMAMTVQRKLQEFEIEKLEDSKIPKGLEIRLRQNFLVSSSVDALKESPKFVIQIN